MKKKYVSPCAKYIAMSIKDDLTDVFGHTGNSSIPEIGFGGGNSEAPPPSANKGLWDEDEEEY
ncbi:MAG: hypothetical protein J5637_07910 [Prevotella sp.]|nr:hypothetical protein [Prevotella sp.]